MATTLRELAVRVTADSSSYQREMSRATRLGSDYYKTMESRSKRFDAYIANNNRSIQAMHAQLTQLKTSALSLATAFAGGFAFTSVVNMADDWGQMAARIKMAMTSVEGSADKYDQVQGRLLEMSNRNAKAIEDSQTLYVSTASSMRDLGYSTEETLDFIEALSNSYTINATSADKVQSSINAISKSMVTGKVSSDQWRTLMLATPNIVTELANSTGKAEKEIKNLGVNGQISMQQLADALIKAKDRTSELADGMGNTVKDGFTQVTNNFKSMIGSLNGELGITQGIASGLKVVADNIELISAAGATLLGVGMIRYFSNFTTSVYEATKQTIANSSATLERARAEQAKATIGLQAIAIEKQSLLTQKQNIIIAQAHSTSLRAQTSLNAQLIAVEAQLDNVRKKEIATTNALTAANSKLSLAKRAASGLLGLLGGPVGLATTLLTVGAGFLMMGDSAKDAKQPLEELQLPLDELLKKYKDLDKARQQSITSAIETEIKVNVKDVDTNIGDIKEKLTLELGGISTSIFGMVRISPENEKAIDEYINQIESLKNKVNEGTISSKEFGQGLHEASEKLKSATGKGKEFDSFIGTLTTTILQNTQTLAGNKEKLDAISKSSVDAASGANELKDALTFPNLDNQLGSLNQQLDLAKIKTEKGGEAAYILAGLQRAAGDEALNHAAALYALASGQDVASFSSEELSTKLKSYVGVLRETYKLNENYKESSKGNGKSTVDVYKSQLDRLNGQINAFTDLTELQKIKRQIAEGELKTLSDTQKKALELKAAEVDRLNAVKEYKSIMDSLRSPAEQQLDTYKEQLSVIQRANLSLQERQELLDKMAQKSMESAPSFSFQDSYNGIGSDLINVAEEEKKLREWNDQQLKIQNELLEQKLINQREYADAVVKIEQTMQQKQKDLQSAYTLAALGTFSSLTGSIADMFKETAGESSAAYKVMFLASKAASIAQAIVSTEVAAVKALEVDPTGVMSGITRGLGYASVGMIASQTIAGMAHSGIDNIPKEGTWLLDKGERVVDARTNADLKDFISSNKSSGNLSITVPVNVGSNDVSEQDGQQLAKNIEQAIRVQLQKEKRPGGILNNR